MLASLAIRLRWPAVLKLSRRICSIYPSKDWFLVVENFQQGLGSQFHIQRLSQAIDPDLAGRNGLMPLESNSYQSAVAVLKHRNVQVSVVVVEL